MLACSAIIISYSNNIDLVLHTRNICPGTIHAQRVYKSYSAAAIHATTDVVLRRGYI